MPVSAFDTLLEKFETGDEVLDGIQSFNNDRDNAFENIAKEITETRMQQSAKIPTSVTISNEKIQNLKNKISLT